MCLAVYFKVKRQKSYRKDIIQMKIVALLLCLFLAVNSQYCRTSGKNILDPSGKQLFLKGISLGNWLNPEGYMLGLDKVNCYRLMDTAFSELLNNKGAQDFWSEFRANYITASDFAYIKKVGFNLIRLPFDYRLFIDDLNPSVYRDQGWNLINFAIAQCKLNNLYLVLDMHSAPGGQTGANIDDSFGYPFLYDSSYFVGMTMNLWRAIANRYKNQSIILGYELLNQPISTEFNTSYFSPKLQPLYKNITTAIREVDTHHIIILDGAVWASQFSCFDIPFDSNLIYTFHKYWVDPVQSNIQDYINFGNKYNVPIWMGESGENTDSWIQTFRVLLEKNGIHWSFWPYKKMNSGSCVRAFGVPAEWQTMVNYMEGDRSSIDTIAKRRPAFSSINNAFKDLVNKIHYNSSYENSGFIRALGLTPQEPRNIRYPGELVSERELRQYTRPRYY